MRILVCFKIVNDLEYITPGELLSLQEGLLDLSVFKKIIGSYDEAALETALRLAENVRRQGLPVTIHALTAGNCEKRFIENLLSLGFDDLFRIPVDTGILWQPELIADHITAFVKDFGRYDVIVTGKQAGPGENGLIPRMLSSKLGLACVPEVISLNWCSRGIKVTFRTDTGQASMTVTKPAVFAVGEAKYPWLRVPTLLEKITAKRKSAGSREPVNYLSAGFETNPASAQFLRYVYTMPKRQCRMIEGKNSEEKFEILWSYLQREISPQAGGQ